MKKAIKTAAIGLLALALIVSVLIWAVVKLGRTTMTGACGQRECPEDKIGELKKMIIQDLSTSEGGKISYHIDYNAQEGDTKELLLGIKNINTNTLNYQIEIKIATLDENNISSSEDYGYSNWFKKINPIGGLRYLKPNDIEVIEIPLVIPKNTKSGVYEFNFNVIDKRLKSPDNIYAQGLITINVKN